MAQSIEIDDEVYEQLKLAAEPFVDTPNTVLRRLLGLDCDGNTRLAAESLPSRVSVAETLRGNGQPQRRRRRTGSASDTSAARVPAGSILAEEEYELPLLSALVDAGGQAPSRDITAAVGQKLGDRLTELDKQRLKSGGIRWENRIQFVRLKMIDRGLMARDTPRGIWAITDSGREHVKATVHDADAKEGANDGR